VIEALLSVRWAELVDLVVVWAMVWAGIAWLRATPARLALAGLGILVAIYLVARQLNLVLTTWILQGFAAVSVLVAVVVFQQDLRRLFEQIAALGLRRRLLPAGPDAIDTLVRAIAKLAEQHHGALIVIPGRESVEGHVEGGLPLGAHVTEPLLFSLFDPHSPGHDGAVIFSGDRVTRFAVHLPLSVDHVQLGQCGTRHAAALGLSERTDALCIAISEERGTVSVAETGQIRILGSPQEVAHEIRNFFARLAPAETERPAWVRRVVQHWRQGLLAMPIAGLLWVLAIPGATVVEIQREAHVSMNGVPQAYQIDAVDPARVQVTLAGRRRDLYFLGPDALEVRVDAILVDVGRRSFALSPANVRHPEGVEVRSIEPDRVKVVLSERQTGNQNKDDQGGAKRP
jgi:diadenylate cyclase